MLKRDEGLGLLLRSLLYEFFVPMSDFVLRALQRFVVRSLL